MQSYIARVFVAVALVIVAVVPVFAGTIPVTTCGQLIKGNAELVGDLDCSGVGGPGIQFESGSLALNGHTLRTPSTNVAVDCIGNCKVVGPGTITGTGSGVNARRALKMTDVVLTVDGSAVGLDSTQGKGRGIIRNCTISDSTTGISVKVPLRMFDTVVTGTQYSGLEISLAPGEDRCSSVLLKRSSITGSGTDPSCGVSRNCADIMSCDKRPRLLESTCGTSCAGNTVVPCTPWGFCSGD